MLLFIKAARRYSVTFDTYVMTFLNNDYRQAYFIYKWVLEF